MANEFPISNYQMNEQLLLNSIKLSFQNKAKKLLSHINNHREVLKWNERDWQNRSALIHFFVKRLSRPHKTPPGAEKFAKSLLETKVPPNTVGQNFFAMFPSYGLWERQRYVGRRKEGEKQVKKYRGKRTW